MSPELYLGRLGHETLFLVATSLDEAKTTLTRILDTLEIERNDNDIVWFKTDRMSKDSADMAFVAQETHLGILEQLGEASIYQLEIKGRDPMMVLARNTNEVLEHMAGWMHKSRIPPPMDYEILELDEESPWVYRFKSVK